MHDQYNQNIKKKYYEECTVFWKDIQMRYEEEVSDSKILMMVEMLANQTTNDDTRKRKHSSGDEDMKPASKH